MRMKWMVVLWASVVALGLPGQTLAQQAAASVKAAKPAVIVNLNAATAAQLASLAGIGDRTAERIIEYRQKNGPFKKSEELMNVKGIGEKGFLKIKDLVTTSPARSEKGESAAGQ